MQAATHAASGHGEHSVERPQGRNPPEQFQTIQQVIQFWLNQWSQPDRVVSPKRCGVSTRSTERPDVGELLDHLEGGRRSDGTLSDEFQEF